MWKFITELMLDSSKSYVGRRTVKGFVEVEYVEFVGQKPQTKYKKFKV